MSVTFSMNQAPVERVQPYPEDDPEYFSVRPAAPFTDINLGESNVIALMQKLDPDSVHYEEDSVSVYGEWDMAKLDVMHSRFMKMLNQQRRQEPLYLDPFISQNPGQCTVYYGGRDEDYIVRTCSRFLELISVARQHEFPVSFG